MSNKQTHTVNIVFDGNFDEFVSFLESRGIQAKFSPAGLAGSQHTLEIDDEKVVFYNTDDEEYEYLTQQDLSEEGDEGVRKNPGKTLLPGV